MDSLATKSEKSSPRKVRERLIVELADALRSVNDLQHRMAIELQNIPQEPRIEYWTRKMEDVICTALESAIGTPSNERGEK